MSNRCSRQFPPLLRAIHVRQTDSDAALAFGHLDVEVHRVVRNTSS